MRLIQIVNELEFLPIESLSHECQTKILAIRNQADVRNNMYTTHEISDAEHHQWLKRIAHDDTNRTFAIKLKTPESAGPIGCVALNSIDLKHRRAEWSFYVSEDQQGKGVGCAVEFKFLDYVFSETEIKKLNCEVLGFNQEVIELHKRFGFVEEGIRRNHILRDGQTHDAHLMGITDCEWAVQRQELTKRLFRERTLSPTRSATSARQQDHATVN
jgi:UDP-4-amino-4,6-dideoxy-N-acetyl-beta-L-altrosamine N-acetyltransferase